MIHGEEQSGILDASILLVYIHWNDSLERVELYTKKPKPGQYHYITYPWHSKTYVVDVYFIV